MCHVNKKIPAKTVILRSSFFVFSFLIQIFFGEMSPTSHFFSKKPSSSWKAEDGIPEGNFTMLHGARSSKAI